MARTALLVGATGLVGRECLRLLLADPAFARVVVVARRPLEIASPPPKLESHVVDFERLADHAALLTADAAICALGTTIKQAGSQERFRRVDFDYPLATARIALAGGARHFLLVSALGANAQSRVFYNRVKGELEAAILALGFPAVTIVRPSLLVGERQQRRLGEVLAAPLLRFAPAKYRPVRARDVARVLVEEAKREERGVRVIESGEIGKHRGD